MSEKGLRNLFIFGTLFFLVILGVMAADTLRQVRTLRTPALSPEVIAGKETWRAKNCNDCHTLLGIGGYYAPELTKVADRRAAAWLSSFLQNPQATKPGTTMPNQVLTAVQANELAAFFKWVSLVDTNGWPPKPMVVLGSAAISTNTGPVNSIQEGQRLFSLHGCDGCHMVNGRGAVGPGPDLSRIGSQPYDALPNDPQFLAKWLENPLAQKPGTTMPRLVLSGAEINALVAYLTSLK